MGEIEVILIDGPCEGKLGIEVEEPSRGDEWPAVEVRDEREAPAHRYVFADQFSSAARGPSLPLYKHDPANT